MLHKPSREVANNLVRFHERKQTLVSFFGLNFTYNFHGFSRISKRCGISSRLGCCRAGPRPWRAPRTASRRPTATRRPSRRVASARHGDTTADRQNFGKLLFVFGCIGTDLCKKIFKHFWGSTRLSNRNLKIWQTLNFRRFCNICNSFDDM